MSDDKHSLRQQISQLESDLRVMRAALSQANAEIARLKQFVPAAMQAEQPRRGRPPKAA